MRAPCMPTEVRKVSALLVLEQHPRGVTAAQVAQALGLSVGRTLEVLRTLRDGGQAQVLEAGPASLWCTAERAPVLAKVLKEQRRQRERTAARRKARELARQHEEEAWLQVTKRVVPLSDCPRMHRPPGPISVFHLAAAW